MNASETPEFLWAVPLVYAGGPRDGQREGRNMREDPHDLTVLQFVEGGGEHAYTVADRRIDRAAGTAVLTLCYATI